MNIKLMIGTVLALMLAFCLTLAYEDNDLVLLAIFITLYILGFSAIYWVLSQPDSEE